jgi:ribosomal protein L11 methyltransferase
MYSKKKTDSWREIDIYNVPDVEGLVANFLFENGCLGITEEPDKMVCYFDANSDVGIAKQIEKILNNKRIKDFRIIDHAIKDEDWHLSWREFFTPQTITDKITVYPEWIKAEENVEIPIMIRPGMAFGTGTHETTQLALQLLEENLLKDMNILDAGCGAGILTIAAQKLGAGSVDSVEIDAEAETNFNENLELNHCSGKMIISDATKLAHYNYDLIVSNIQIGPNTALLETLQNQNYHNPIIFTGILTKEGDQFRKIVRSMDRKITKEILKNEWMAFLVTK